MFSNFSSDEEAPLIVDDDVTPSSSLSPSSSSSSSSSSHHNSFTISRAVSIAASISILTVAGIALFHTVDINEPSVTSLGEALHTRAEANLFDTVLEDLEKGFVAAEEAMGIVDPRGQMCILRPEENVGKRCKSTSGLTKFSVDAVDGKWPQGFSWTILRDVSDNDFRKDLLHTEVGQMSQVTAANKNCGYFVTEICAPDKFIVYASSENEVSRDSAVSVCGKKVGDGEAMDFTEDFFTCQTATETDKSKKSLLKGLALSGPPLDYSGSLSGVSGSMNYGSLPLGREGGEGGESGVATEGGSGESGVATEGGSSNSTEGGSGEFVPPPPDESPPTEGNVPRQQISSEGDSYKICNVNNIPRSYLLDGVHVGAGCVALADKDLTTIPQNPEYTHANLVIICGNNASGTVQLDKDTLGAYDLIFEEQSLLSSMVLDAASNVKFFKEDGFTGVEKHYAGTKVTGTVWAHANEPFTFAGQKFSSPHPPFVNLADHVQSIEFSSTTDEITDCGSYDELKKYFKKDSKMLSAAMKDLKLNAKEAKKSLSARIVDARKEEEFMMQNAKSKRSKKMAYEKKYKETMAKKKAAKKAEA